MKIGSKIAISAVVRSAQETIVSRSFQGNCPGLLFNSKDKRNSIQTELEVHYPRFVRRMTAALCSRLLTSGPTPICLCKPFSCKACVETDSARHPCRPGKSRRPVSTSFRPERAKKHGTRTAILYSVPEHAFRLAPAALQYSCCPRADFCRPSFPQCFVLKSLTPAVGFSSTWRVRFHSRYLDS